MTLTEKVNPHVEKLFSYLPFGSGHGQIYEEHSDTEHVKSIPTRAADFLLKMVSRPEVRLIVLTGDAGHGKTHICRRLIESVLSIDPIHARQLLVKNGGGRHDLGQLGNRALRIVSDLSELADDASAAQLLSHALSAGDHILVVCANEGKLRKVVSVDPVNLGVVRETMESTLATGRTFIDPAIYVVDLNLQSLTVPTMGTEKEFARLLLQQWTDGRSWRICAECTAKEYCPILANRTAFAGSDAKSEIRVSGLLYLLRVVEQTGFSITIREMLILVAFMLTGGLRCSAVHSVSSQHKQGEQFWRRFQYFQVLFVPPVPIEQQRSLRLLTALRRVDPGRQALRSVDEVVLAKQSEAGSIDAGAKRRIEGSSPKSRKAARGEAEQHLEWFRFLRRKDYFELNTDEPGNRITPRHDRLGFRFHAKFEFLLGRADDKQRVEARDLVIKGLEAVQDLRRRGAPTKFAVVDPAFANVAGNASILATEINAIRVKVKARSATWDIGSEEASVVAALDWIDRQVLVVFDGLRVELPLDLLEFEFLARSAEGLSCRNFFRADIRRITATLARLAENVPGSDGEIKVIFSDRPRSLMIDEGGTIRCELQ